MDKEMEKEKNIVYGIIYHKSQRDWDWKNQHVFNLNK